MQKDSIWLPIAVVIKNSNLDAGIVSRIRLKKVQQVPMTITLREKCPYSEFFWSIFSRIWTEYGEKISKLIKFSFDICVKIFADVIHNVGEILLLIYRGVFRTCYITKMELFVKIVNGWRLLLFPQKALSLDVWQGSEYASDKELLTIAYFPF